MILLVSLTNLVTRHFNQTKCRSVKKKSKLNRNVYGIKRPNRTESHDNIKI